jgi:hypothetical protein
MQYSIRKYENYVKVTRNFNRVGKNVFVDLPPSSSLPPPDNNFGTFLVSPAQWGKASRVNFLPFPYFFPSRTPMLQMKDLRSSFARNVLLIFSR